MKTYNLKSISIPKVAVLATGITATILVATINPAPAAQAFPSTSKDCAGCHTAGGSTTAAPSTPTPAAAAGYTVAIPSRQTRLAVTAGRRLFRSPRALERSTAGTPRLHCPTRQP